MLLKQMVRAFVVLVLGLGVSCSVFRDRLYEYRVPGTALMLDVYRVPIGLADARFELRLESPRESILLESREGDWFRIACAAAVVSPDRPVVNYVIAITNPEVYIGAYDLTTKRKMNKQEVDLKALRAEIRRLYRGLPRFPEDDRIDLLEWATDINSCQEAFWKRYSRFTQ